MNFKEVLYLRGPLITVKDNNMKRIAILEHAYNISVNRRVNELWTASFCLPADDVKNEFCNHMYFVEIEGSSGRNYGLYRIMPTETRKSLNVNEVKYTCEHVLATLIDDVVDGYHQFSGHDTAYVLQAILDMQSIKRWQLGDVEFNRRFHYSFENENGLLAPILSIPQPFNEPYEFTFDTAVYPWKLNLVRPSNQITSEIRWGKDLREFHNFSDPSNIVNYIVPKGAGEGVNQLTIESVNDGKRYIKDDESIAKWGRQSYIWIDRRYEDAQSLLESAQAKLDKWKEPELSFEVDAVDLSILPEYADGERLLNGITRIVVEDGEYTARITSEYIPDISEEWDVTYNVSNNIEGAGDAFADLERRQEVHDAYSQGATNIMTFGYQDNADGNIPAVIPFYIDDDVVNVNTCELTFRLKPFRAYSRATEGGGSIVKSTSSGGGTTATSSSGGGVAKTTASGGGSSQTSSSGGGTSTTSGPPNAMDFIERQAQTGETNGHTHTYWQQHWDLEDIGTHKHTINISPHRHSVEIPSHRHEFNVPNHTHSVNIPNHSHEISIPEHTHEVIHQIIELDELPSRVAVKVDGKNVPHTAIEGDRIDLTDYIAKDSNGKIKRGRHELTIQPNGLARIEADLIMRVFIRSHIGKVM